MQRDRYSETRKLPTLRTARVKLTPAARSLEGSNLRIGEGRRSLTTATHLSARASGNSNFHHVEMSRDEQVPDPGTPSFGSNGH